MSGFIKLHRGWENSRQFRKEPYCERAAWCWLLSNAAWKETTRTNGKGELIKVQPGQIHVSLRSLESAWGWSKGKVERFLIRLETETALSRETGQSGCILTLCNWRQYQDVQDSRRDGRGTETGMVAGQSRDTQEEGKEIKEEKKDTPLPPKGVRKPDDVSDEVWSDWKRVRKKPVTATVLKRMETEAAKLGWTLAQAINEAAESGWQGFKAEYVKGHGHGNNERKDGVAKALDRRLGLGQPAGSAERCDDGSGAGDSLFTTPRLADLR